MKTKLLWVIGSISALSFTALPGCGDDDEPADETGGTSGSTSKGGTTGKGGSGGSTSKGGTTGAAGETGDAGETGTGGEPAGGGGDTGTGGEPGGGGDTGAGGGGGDAERADACAEYCTTYFEACEGDNNEYADEDACNTTCVGSDWALEGATGNTIECRQIHAENAANANDPGDVAGHCGHAAAEPTMICTD